MLLIDGESAALVNKKPQQVCLTGSPTSAGVLRAVNDGRIRGIGERRRCPSRERQNEQKDRKLFHNQPLKQ